VRRTERLFAIAEYLRGRRTGVTAATLAERFGVTLRTVYRDLDSLRDASLPVAAERGRGGGFALDRAYALPPVNFGAREAAVLLVLAAWAREHRVIPFTEALDSATDKVRAALSTSSQRQLIEHLATLTFVGVPAPKIESAVRRAVERAWFEGRPLSIRYRGRDDIVTQRRIMLRSIVMDRAETRLNATDLTANDAGEARQFQLHRIERAVVLAPEAWKETKPSS
jgi:predicted DNA-binding transcriptional regulator YafY